MAIRFVILFVAATLASASPVEDHESTYNNVVLPHVLKCAQESDSPPDLFKLAKESGSADGISGCFMNCVFKGIGIMTEEGLYDQAKSEELAKLHLKKDDEVAKVTEVTKLCAKVNDAEVTDGKKGCERASLLFKCALEHKGVLLPQ